MSGPVEWRIACIELVEIKRIAAVAATTHSRQDVAAQGPSLFDYGAITVVLHAVLYYVYWVRVFLLPADSANGIGKLQDSCAEVPFSVGFT